MRPVVALVEATPETIIEDYRRVCELAGLAEPCGVGPVALVPQAVSGGWLPGAGSPPWQLDGVLEWLVATRERAASAAPETGQLGVMPISPTGGPCSAVGWGWEEVLARHGVRVAAAKVMAPRSYRADPALPALTTVCPEGLQVPAGLFGRQILLLPVPSLDTRWPVAGAVALLRGLLACQLKPSGQVPTVEIIAEIVGLAKQALGGVSTVTDAVVWEVRGGGLSRRPVNRNILLAGTDPVAVDAVTMRLAGQDPEQVPWLRLCHERGVGTARLQDIRIAGRQDLLKLDFGVSGRTFAGGSPLRQPNPLADRVWRVFRKSAILKKHSLTPWGRLLAEYRADAVQGESP